MIITNEWLKERKACIQGIKWFENQDLTDSNDIIKHFIENKKHIDWASWLIVRTMEYKQYVSYAVFAVEQVIDIFKGNYPLDNIAMEAMESAKKCIDNPNIINKENASYCFPIACEEKYGAYEYDSAYATYASTAFAAQAAANDDAYAACAAAYAVSYYYNDSALYLYDKGHISLDTSNRKDAMMTKILKYGLALLCKEGEI